MFIDSLEETLSPIHYHNGQHIDLDLRENMTASKALKARPNPNSALLPFSGGLEFYWLNFHGSIDVYQTMEGVVAIKNSACQWKQYVAK